MPYHHQPSVAHRVFVGLSLLLALCLWGPISVASAQQPNAQVLAFSGNLPNQPDGPVALRLRLYNANAAGTPLFEETQTVTVASQTFLVRIGDATPSGVPATLFRDNPSLWIAFALDSAPDQEIGPRAAITSGGYAHTAALLSSPVVKTLNGLAGDVALAAGTNVTITPSGNALTIDAAGSGGLPSVSHDGTLIGSGTVGSPLAVAAPLQLTSGVSGSTIVGTNSSGFGSGVSGASPAGWGVRGSTTSGQGLYGLASGTGIGVNGESASGTGVRGQSASGTAISGLSSSGFGMLGNSGSNTGVLGQTGATTQNTAGIRGEATASSGQVVGVFGNATNSPIGTGIVGVGGATGGYFQANAGNGVIGTTPATASNTTGVLGLATGPSGFVSGVVGAVTASPDGRGVYGYAPTTGGFFQATSATGGNGVSATTASTVPNMAGVRGEAAASSGSVVGVWGAASNSPDGTGLVGLGGANGVIGRTSSTAQDVAGVRGETTANSGQVAGIYGDATSSPAGTGVVGKGGATGGYFSGLNAYGVYAQAINSPTGTGVAGIGTATGGYFQATAPDGNALVVNGSMKFRYVVLPDPSSPVCSRYADGYVTIGQCASSLRYKTNVRSFSGGLDLVSRLRPITFTWKKSGDADIGLAAEQVAEVEPLLTFRNDKGEIEGVKYNLLSAVLVNAITEQQAQIEHQQDEIQQQRERLTAQQHELTAQQRELAALKTLVCRLQPADDVCK